MVVDQITMVYRYNELACELIQDIGCITQVALLPITAYSSSKDLNDARFEDSSLIIAEINILYFKSLSAMDPLFTPQHWRMQNSPQPQNGYQKFEYKGKYIVSNEKRMSKADLIEQNEHYKESSFNHDSEPNSLLHENEYEYGTLMEEYYSNNLSSHPSASNFSKPTMNKIIRESNDNFYANDKNNFKLKTKSKNKRNFN